MVHQVRRARDRGGGEGQRVDEARLRQWGRWDGDAIVVVEVVREAHRDSAVGGAGEGVRHDRRERVRQADVVDRDLERLLCRAQPRCERMCGVLGGLAAVDERAKLYRAAFCAALCARLAVW